MRSFIGFKRFAAFRYLVLIAALTLAAGAQTIDYTRYVTVYVPAQYVAGTEAPFVVGHDGPRGKPDMTLPHILDNLIAAKRATPILAVSVKSRHATP